MATWEDGPEYAPVERPAAFAEPAHRVGLDSPAPPPPEPALPTEQPVFADPSRPGPPLASLVPDPPASRDPRQPFDVASSVMTAESSAWASAHWAQPQPGSGQPTAPQAPITLSPSTRGSVAAAPTPYPTGQALNGPTATTSNGRSAPPAAPPPDAYPGPTYPPPTGMPSYPAPAGPPSYPAPGGSPGYPPPSSGPMPNSSPFPAPGTNQWFGPGGYQQPPPAPPVPDARAVIAAATPGMLVTLLIGGFIWILAPITLILGFFLSRRMTYGRKATQTAFGAVLAFLGLVGVVSAVTTDGVFSDWWADVAGWGCFGSWVLLVLTAVLVHRAVKQGRPDQPPDPRTTLR